MLALMLQQEAVGGPVEKIARTFGVDWPHLTAQLVSFAIVCAVLYWLAYKPVLRMLEARRQQIALGLANAEKIKAELDKTEAQRREVMAQAHTQGPNSSRRPGLRRPASSKRKAIRQLRLPHRSWPRRTKLLRRTTIECSPNSNARSAGWWCKPRPRSPVRF